MSAPANLAAFKSAVRRGQVVPLRPLLRKEVSAPATPGEGRTLRFIASTGGVDREGDTLAVDGWQLADYRRNPVVLWLHDADSLPIGKATSVGVVGGVLRVTIAFVPADMPVAGPRAEAIYQMCRKGFLSAVSVGFKPIEWKAATDKERAAHFGIDFTRQELCEVSIVAIPLDGNALIEPGQVSAGATCAWQERQAMRVLAWS